MAKKKTIVTNAMRILQSAKVEFEAIEYECDGEIGEDFGEEISRKTGIPPEKSFKTLVIRGEKNGIMVACIPVSCEVDLKELAKISNDKKVEMIHVKELLGLTGYIRGGVTPIGMKKKYPTYIDSSCMQFDKIAVSAGICGCTLLLSPTELIKIVDAQCADIAKNKI